MYFVVFKLVFIHMLIDNLINYACSFHNIFAAYSATNLINREI